MMKGTELEKIEIQPYEHVDFDQEWLHIIQRLPNPSSQKKEVILQRGHRCPFDYAFTIPGAKLHIIGSKENCSVDELVQAINEKTLAIGFMARYEDNGLSLTEVISIAKEKSIPVIVDAASEIPPVNNLTKYITEGADLVIISGGKHLCGPNDTGILCGRKDLIKLAKLQSAPYRGIGRGMKVDRTQIIGLISAIKQYLRTDEKELYNKWKLKADFIYKNLYLPTWLDKKIVYNEKRKRVFVHLITNENLYNTINEMVLGLRKGEPSIWVTKKYKNAIEIDTSNLKDEEEKTLVDQINNITRILS
jgi:L-seryl-tRNA(Ser) seleniumtransferase